MTSFSQPHPAQSPAELLAFANRVIAALLIETNLIESERQRRRDKTFRGAVEWLHGMAVRGEIEIPEPISRFESLDGIYVVDEQSSIRYMSGIATNLFRTIGLATELRGQHGSHQRARPGNRGEVVPEHDPLIGWYEVVAILQPFRRRRPFRVQCHHFGGNESPVETVGQQVSTDSRYHQPDRVDGLAPG